GEPREEVVCPERGAVEVVDLDGADQECLQNLLRLRMSGVRLRHQVVDVRLDFAELHLLERSFQPAVWGVPGQCLVPAEVALRPVDVAITPGGLCGEEPDRRLPRTEFGRQPDLFAGRGEVVALECLLGAFEREMRAGQPRRVPGQEAQRQKSKRAQDCPPTGPEAGAGRTTKSVEDAHVRAYPPCSDEAPPGPVGPPCGNGRRAPRGSAGG